MLAAALLALLLRVAKAPTQSTTPTPFLLHIINNNRTPVSYKLSSPPLGIGVGVVVYKTVLLFVIPRINRKLGVGVTHHQSSTVSSARKRLMRCSPAQHSQLPPYPVAWVTDIPALLTLSHGEGKRAGQIPAQRMLLGRFLMANPVSTEVTF